MGGIVGRLSQEPLELSSEFQRWREGEIKQSLTFGFTLRLNLPKNPDLGRGGLKGWRLLRDNVLLSHIFCSLPSLASELIPNWSYSPAAGFWSGRIRGVGPTLSHTEAQGKRSECWSRTSLSWEAGQARLAFGLPHR